MEATERVRNIGQACHEVEASPEQIISTDRDDWTLGSSSAP
jgi:hypothetical protein